MSDIIRTILIMSLSGAIVAGLLFALKPLVRDRLPKSAQYYLWLVVITALLVPVSKLIVIQKSDAMPLPIAPIQSALEQIPLTRDDEVTRWRDNPDRPQTEEEVQRFKSNQSNWLLLPYLYPFAATAVLLYFIISYSVFIRLHRRRNNVATTEENAMLAEICGNRRTPRLYRNPLAATPMLIGLFHPAIILPDREYTDEQLRVVLLHELTHLRRKDILIKWLSVLACSVHWFNPIVWLMRREIDRACELACDEAVIRNFNTDGKQNYGETLLYVAADSKTPRAVLSTTMCEEKKALKERLGAIMKSKKHTQMAIIVSVALLVVAGGVALALGAGSKTTRSNYNFDTFVVSGYKLYGYMDNEAISQLTPTAPLDSKSGYNYNFEEIRFDLDNNECISRFQLAVYDIGIYDMWFQYSDNHPDKREGNNGLAFIGDGDDILRQIGQVEALVGVGQKGWYDREQQLRYARYTADNGHGEVTFVYTDGEDNGIMNRLVWVIADGGRNSHSPAKTPDKTPLLDVNLVTVNANGNSQTQISRDVRAAQLTNDWYVVDENGDGSGYTADSFHPLQKQDGFGDITLWLNNSGVVTLSFSDDYPPQSVSVQRWNAEYAGTDSVDVWDKGESVNVTNNTFQVNDDGNNYIYEVYAKWPEGSSWYVFRIDSSFAKWQQIHLGTPIDTVHELLGEPDGFTSGLWSEFYEIDESTTVQYHYRQNESDTGVVYLIFLNGSQIEPWQKDITQTPATWSLNQSLGADNPSLDYAGTNAEGHNWVIFHGYFGLFVYDTDVQKIVYSLDLKSIGCDYTQGDAYCEVNVNDMGDTVTLHPMNSDTMFVLHLWSDGKRLYETPVVGNENYMRPFQTVSIETAFPDNSNFPFGKYSDRAVMFSSVPTDSVSITTDDSIYFGSLYFNDTSLGGICYVVDDMVFELFK